MEPTIALFADDVAAWVASRSLNVIEIREEWMSDWRTKLSITKTVYTVFNKSGTFIHNQIELTYHNQPLKAERNPKFLGITLDPSPRSTSTQATWPYELIVASTC